ncbi:MAG: hypothetical protein IJ729_04720 [Alloprevotella sp.]|nr:hypothetical protein [Alloprevotella sp.]
MAEQTVAHTAHCLRQMACMRLVLHTLRANPHAPLRMAVQGGKQQHRQENRKQHPSRESPAQLYMHDESCPDID